MRTEHIEYDRTIYRLDELSSEAREKAHAEYLRSGASSDWFDGDGVRDVIKKVEDFFDCRIYGWCVDSYRPEYPSVDFRNEDRLDLKGERARAWFWNNYGKALFPFHRQGEGKYNEKTRRVEYKRTSRIFHDKATDGLCIFTGICWDNDALDAVSDFMLGKTGRDATTTVESVIRDSIHGLFRALNKEAEYRDSFEAFSEASEANNWEYLEDGTMA